MTDNRKKCLICKSLFVPYRPYQKYCDDDCRKAAYKNWYSYKPKPTKERECKLCGNTFLTNDSKRKYCTTECYLEKNNLTKKKLKSKVCPICKKTFKTTSYIKKYCNIACYKRNKRNEHNKVS